MLLWTSLSPPAPSSNLAPPTASISSKKIKQAFLVLAISKSSLTILAPSPTYFWTSSEPITLIKQASVLFATALAQRVLPVPGGPYRRTPLGGSIPKLLNLLFAASDVTVGDVRLLLDLHHGDGGVNLGRQRNVDLVFVPVNSTSHALLDVSGSH